ncbi:tetratricopeptide repeat protein [Flaviflexus sp.]|uniref:tetratricopeptide repeat protein n=1 Tax=Flaviflexus sp. TaxID=1969482 RepID=UPI003F93C90F
MAGSLMDDNPELAYEHAKAAYRRASRIDIVREALGLTAYANEKYGEALRELRTYRRMSGDISHAYLEADCERGMGKPDRAVKYLEDINLQELEPAAQIELALVVSGAYADLEESEKGLKLIETLKVDTFSEEMRAPVELVRAERLRELGREEEAVAVEARWSALWDQETIEVLTEAIESEAYAEDSDEDSYGAGDWDDSADSSDSARSVESAQSADDAWDDERADSSDRFADDAASEDQESMEDPKDVEFDEENVESDEVLDDADVADDSEDTSDLDESVDPVSTEGGDANEDEAGEATESDEPLDGLEPELFAEAEADAAEDVVEDEVAVAEVAEEAETVDEFEQDEANVGPDEVLDDARDVLEDTDESDAREGEDDDNLVLPGLENLTGDAPEQDDLFSEFDEGETK